MDVGGSPLLTDLYQLNMTQAYLDCGKTETAVFEFFIRKLPDRRGFLMAAGLEQALDYLTQLNFSPPEVEWLAKTGRFNQKFIDYLSEFRFTGDVHAMPEGTIFFANEPILRVTAPLPEAQLVETRLMNILHFQSLIASKAARYKLAAPNQSLIDFGFRRSHGLEAGLMAARASYIAGFTGTATVMAGKLFAIPIFGTLAHSFIQAFDDESDAFEAFARARPENLTLLIDTYDTERGAEKVVALAPRLKEAGIGIGAVRLDSGDLISLSKSVRRILDTGGLESVLIFASGGITEDQILAMAAADAPINGFGVGTDLTVSSDVPALDCAYKLQEYAGVARRKQSTGKATWPGRKQVWRNFDADGCMTGDVISLEDDDQAGEPLIKQVMKGGVRLCPLPTLDEIRDRAASGLEHLPEPLRRLELGASYPILIADRLQELAEAVDRRLTR
ncbi:MAG TPA: nicotinate phosphoribosyltransferase [Hyphomicrobiales bacterium]|jgi:nicotinate phosphoribosyltransferase